MGCALVIHGGLVGGVDLVRVVAAACEACCSSSSVRCFDQFEQSRDICRRMLADVCAGFDGVLLILAIHDFAHALQQQAGVSRASRASQSPPQMTLMTFQPAPRKMRFQFLDDLAVAAHRAVEPLQVAIDDEDQVVEFFARGQRDGAQRFRLVRFAVAHEAHTLVRTAVFEPAIFAGSALKRAW